MCGANITASEEAAEAALPCDKTHVKGAGMGAEGGDQPWRQLHNKYCNHFGKKTKHTHTDKKPCSISSLVGQ